MPVRGDNLESITASAVIDHHANAWVVYNGVQYRMLFESPAIEVGYGRRLTSDVVSVITEPSLTCLDSDAALFVEKSRCSINGVEHSIIKKLPDGSGLTVMTVSPVQASNPARGAWR